jgi:hypothetical protein
MPGVVLSTANMAILMFSWNIHSRRKKTTTKHRQMYHAGLQHSEQGEGLWCGGYREVR